MKDIDRRRAIQPERPGVDAEFEVLAPVEIFEGRDQEYDLGAVLDAFDPGEFESREIEEQELLGQCEILLQEREFERLGSNKVRQIDVRVVAATNVDLRAALEEGTFREDLYYRLNVMPIDVPPLRERKEDIPFLAEFFVKKLAKEMGSPAETLAEDALQKLVGYHWPGNVRELQNVIERSLVLCNQSAIHAADVRLDASPHRARTVAASDSFLPEGMTLDEHEQALIREALKRANGNKSHAARLLGLTRNALRYRLSQMGIE